ncbi:MAG: methionyl-tRNA formyltransferase [Solirubrobacterales bacterium]
MRIVFMGTAPFAVPTLHNLILAGHDVRLVVTQPDRPAGRGKQLKAPPVKELALEFGIECAQPESVRTDAFLNQLSDIGPDVIVVVAYGRILPEPVLTLPPLGCINLHGSLLPAYRGAAPVQRAIMAGEPMVGVTTMHMDRTMDTGDIILRRSVQLVGDEDHGQVAEVLSRDGAALMLDTLDQLEWGTAPRIPQDHTQATYAPPLGRDDEMIDWTRPARDLMNQIRGLSPAPGAFTGWRGGKLKLFKTRVIESDGGKSGEPGEIVEVGPEGFTVSAGSGRLLVLELQREGKKRGSAADFLMGSRLAVGERLGAPD